MLAAFHASDRMITVDWKCITDSGLSFPIAHTHTYKHTYTTYGIPNSSVLAYQRQPCRKFSCIVFYFLAVDVTFFVNTVGRYTDNEFGLGKKMGKKDVRSIVSLIGCAMTTRGWRFSCVEYFVNIRISWSRGFVVT